MKSTECDYRTFNCFNEHNRWDLNCLPNSPFVLVLQVVLFSGKNTGLLLGRSIEKPTRRRKICLV